MSLERVRAITQRILQQFRRDHRTLALLFGAPLVILALLGYLLRGGGDVPQMGVVNLDGGGLGSVVASALERSKTVAASPMSQAEAEAKLRSGDIAGYVLLPSDFSVKAQQSRLIAPEVHLEGSQPGLSQSILQAMSEPFAAPAGQAGGVRFAPRAAVLYVQNAGNVALIFVLEALMAIAAVNLGIFLSMFARTECQAVQFIPLVIVPQMLLAGIIFPVSTEPGPLQALSHVLPLTYAVEGLRNIMIKGANLTWSSLQLDFAVVLGFCILVILAGATTLRRRIA